MKFSKLDIGILCRTREAGIVEVIGFNPKDGFPLICEYTYNHQNFKGAWLTNGKSNADYEDPFDIITKLPKNIFPEYYL